MAMRAVIVQAANDVALVEAPVPMARPGWALIRLRATGVCATDLEVMRGRIPATYPLILGHEWSGVVEAVGSPDDDAWVGARIVGENEVSCLLCTACRRGHWRYCAQYQQIGFGLYGGGYADYLVVPTYDLHRLPSNVSFEQAALLEPLAVAFGVVSRADVRPGDTVTILGDGSIGLHSLLVSLRAGARRVIMVGGQPARLEMAARLGAAQVLDFRHDSVPAAVARHHGRSDIVIEASGTAEGVAQAVRLVRKEGVIVLAGHSPENEFTLSQGDVHNANVSVVGVSGGAGWMGRALACVADGLINSEQIVSHRYALQDYAAALEQCESREGGLVKSMFVW